VHKGSSLPKAHLIPLPVISEPFTRVLIDIVGPLQTCSKSANRFVLTVMDMATHYVEAIPMKEHTAISVANALALVFSHFGFPKEIQSDLGTEFCSDLMKTLLESFDIKHIKSSAFHPESQGQLEQFHRTMKNMIRTLDDKFKEDWDIALPWILFAYRECPVETLGFSPFELLYAYQVRGPLSLIKSCWTDTNTDFGSNKANVVSYMLQARERLKMARELAKEVTEEARSTSKSWFDKKARFRIFEPGDSVLILLPRAGHPLEAKYKGPYTV
jgi:hypothetical protein